MRRFFRAFGEHWPLAEALVAGLLAAAGLLLVRGMGLAGLPVEWPLLTLLLLGFARPVGWQAMVLAPGAVLLALLDGLAAGGYLLAGAGALIVCHGGARLPDQAGDPVSRFVRMMRCSAGWLAVRLLQGGGVFAAGGVAGAFLLAVFLVVLLPVAAQVAGAVFLRGAGSAGRALG